MGAGQTVDRGAGSGPSGRSLGAGTPEAGVAGEGVPGSGRSPKALIRCASGQQWPSLADGAHWAVPGWTEGSRPPALGRTPFLFHVSSINSERLWLFEVD